MNKHIALAIQTMQESKEIWRNMPKTNAAKQITPDVYKLMCQRIVDLDKAIEYLKSIEKEVTND